MTRATGQMARIVVGTAPAAKGSHSVLAGRIADFARDLGYRVGGIEASRCGNSNSRYLTVFDRMARRWIIRVSDHRKPAVTAHQTPHLDLVSLDGTSGFDEAARYLGMARCGGVEWFDPAATVRQPRRRR